VVVAVEDVQAPAEVVVEATTATEGQEA
jgi:hypothetical protein